MERHGSDGGGRVKAREPGRRAPANRGAPWRVLAAAAVLAAGTGAVDAGAQEAGGARVAEPAPAGWTARFADERAKLGVFLRESCRDLLSTPETGACPRPPVIERLVEGGPAEAAGLLVGDTLLAIDGRALTSPAGRRALAGLEEGRAVRVRIGREGERLVRSIVPRRLEQVGVFRMMPPTGGIDLQTGERTWVLRLPARDSTEIRDGELRGALRLEGTPPAEALTRLRLRLDSVAAGSPSMIVVRGDSGGVFQLEVVETDRLSRALRSSESVGGVVRRLRGTDESGERRARIEAEAYEVREARPFRHPGDPEAEERAREAAADFYVWNDPELARRLVSVRDSSLRDARAALDSLVRMQATFEHRQGQLEERIRDRAGSRERPAPEGRMSERSLPPGPPLPVRLRALVERETRLAGAEFQELNPDLARYFEGAEHGLLVIRVLPRTPAARLGLQGGDVVVEADGRPLPGVEALRAVLRDAEGDVRVRWVRRGETMEGTLRGS